MKIISVRYLNLKGPLKLLRTEEFDTANDALAAVKRYAEQHGFTDVVIKDDDNPSSFRYTATTPGGRKGRNIAFADWMA